MLQSSAVDGRASNGAGGGRKPGILRRILLNFLAVALCFGTLGGALAAIAATSTQTASATTGATPGVTEHLDCWAVPTGGPSGETTTATDTLTIAATSTPASVDPGGAYTLTFAPTAVETVPAKTSGYTISGLYTVTERLALPAGVTVVSGPTVTSQGYYYKPSTPNTHVALDTTVALDADSNAPGKEIIKEYTSTNIPGGDDYVVSTISIELKAVSPTSDSIGVGLVNVPPAGSAHTSSDPGFSFKTKVTGVPLYGTIVANLNCWPYPNPQPVFVTTSVIDTTPPAITIATPGNTSQVVQNSTVHSAFGCTDPAVYGDGIKSCTATNTGNALSDGGTVTTATLGRHTVTVHAVNNSTFASTQTSTYTVIKPQYNLVPPTVTINSPANGAQYVTGSTHEATFTCTAATGTTITSCTGTVADGTSISTTAGYHTFTVKALDKRGDPTTVTVGYYALSSTSNSKVTTTSSDVAVNSTESSSNYNCSLFDKYNKQELDGLINDSETCVFGTHVPEATWKVTGPAAKGGQLAVGDKLTVEEQIYRPGAMADSTNGGYDSGPYSESLAVDAPSGTKIDGPITTSTTGLPSATYGGTASAQTASACNYNYDGADGTGSGDFCTNSTGNLASTTASAAGSTTVGAYGSTTVGAYGSTTVSTLFSTTVTAKSAGKAVDSSTLHVASLTNAPTTSGHLEVATSTGVEVIAYTSTSTSTSTCGTSAEPCFRGVTVVSGNGSATVATGAVVRQPTTVHNLTVLPIAATTGFMTTGTNLATVTTSTGPAVVSYTGSSTTAGTCGKTPCLTGVTYSSGSGTIAKSDAVNQVDEPVTAFTGATTGAAGVLHATSDSGFQSSGTLTVATSTGTVTVSYTGDSTTAATCGSAACFTGVTVKNGGKGIPTVGGAMKQPVPSVSSFTGTGVLHAAADTGFTSSGTLEVATSTGTAVLSYTGDSTTAATCGSAACFTGVSLKSGSGTLTVGGAVTQAEHTIKTDTGSGTLAVASVTGFHSPGLVAVATSNGTAYLSYTGTSGSSLTGVTARGGASGLVTAGGSVVESGLGGDGYTAWTTLGSASVTVGSLAGGGGTLDLASATSTPFSTSGGTVEVVTTNGVQTLSYTGISGNTLTGVTAPGGASGAAYAGALVAEPTATAIHGATKINGVAVSGWTWSVTANDLSTFSVTWNGSSCQSNTGTPKPSANAACGTNSAEQRGIDGTYILLKYSLVVTGSGTVTFPGISSIGAEVHDYDPGAGILTSKDEFGSTGFSTGAISAPGITFTAVDPNPPTATLSTPTQGAAYAYGQTVDANYSCTDPTSGVTITSCTGVEDTGTSYQKSIASGSALTTSDLVPNEIHTFTVTATNSEGYTSKSYATFVTLASPPALDTQTVTVTAGKSVTVPFNYSATYPATLSTERIVTQPEHGTVAIQPTGKITYTNDNTPNATDSFQFTVTDTADNPANVETVNIHVQNLANPTITATTPPATGSGSYARRSTVTATYSCGDNVEVLSCTASQTVTGVTTPVADGSPVDTTSLIVGNTHHLKITAVGWPDDTTVQTVAYTVDTPAPVASNVTVSTIDPSPVLVSELTHVTSTFPLTPSTVTVVTPPTYGTTTVEPSGQIRYTPTTASSTSVTVDSFTYTVKDTDGQVSNPATVTVTVYPVPVVSSISPTAGPLAKGTLVTLTGTGLAKVTAVHFGSTPATSFTVVSNTKITAVAPAAPGGSPGTENVTVTAPGGTSATSATTGYTWDPVPTLTSVSPTQGVLAGGGTITVKGTGDTVGRAGTTVVDFGSTPATDVVVNATGTELTATIPAAASAGTVTIRVTTPGGTTSGAHYAYLPPTPQVTGISPTAGPPAGGTTVVVTGNSFSGATTVSFGSTPATSFTVDSNTEITAKAPAATGGTRVNVTVTGPGGTSPVVTSDQYTYGPDVTGISPSSGSAVGGTSVTITGAQLSGATAVHFGTTSATFKVTSTTRVTATSPATTAGGVVNVTVTTPAGTSVTSAADQFTYTAPVPSVGSVSPAGGPTAGGTAVTITGNGFTGATAVDFGGTAATGVTVVSNTKVTATSPAGSAGTVNVTVTTPGGTSPTSSLDDFTYGPSVSGVSPDSGTTAGGTTVTVTGLGFTGATAVDFGSTPATHVTVGSGSSITATSPAGSPGTVNVTVVTPGGTSPVVSADQFTYTNAAPVVTSLTPSNGPAAGGTTVTVEGTGFTGATAVDFGTTAGTSVAVNGSGTQLTVVSPAGTSGATVNVRVVAPGGTSGVVTADQFTYGPTITRISPTSGSTAGGTSVTITGTGFTGATAVDFGSTPATSFTVKSATSVTATAPASATAGAVAISVVTPGGSTPATSADLFTYKYPVPAVSSLSSSVGSPAGGTHLTITGSGFTGATAVSFGTTPATSFTVVSSTSVTAVVPAGTPTATVNVRVTGPGGTSATSSATAFTYGPVVTSVSPNSGGPAGGTTVTVKGAGFKGATAVSFGSTVVSSGITVNATGTQITVKSPAGSAGKVNVTVTAGGHTSLTNTVDGFTYT